MADEETPPPPPPERKAKYDEAALALAAGAGYVVTFGPEVDVATVPDEAYSYLVREHGFETLSLGVSVSNAAWWTLTLNVPDA